MKRTICLLIPLLALSGAAPATRPAAAGDERVLVQVRTVQYPLPPGVTVEQVGVREDSEYRIADLVMAPEAKERSSVQVSAVVGAPFECTAVINGTTYHLAGTVKKRPAAAGADAPYQVAFDYAETTEGAGGGRSVHSVSTNLMIPLEKSFPVGGVVRGPTDNLSMVVTLKRR